MLDAYRDLIDELLGTPTEIRSLLDPASDTPMTHTVATLVTRLRDRDRVVLERAQTITRQENPYLTAISLPDPEANLDLGTLLEEMETARGDLVSLLINLSLKDWERVAVHETEGEVSLSDEIEEHVEFDEDMRRQLREAVAGP